MPEDIRLNEDHLVLSEHYAPTMDEAVLPYLQAREKDVTVPGDGGVPLSVRVFSADAPRGTVLIMHGFTESAHKFSEFIYSFLQNGYSVVAYDQRGHGHSGRDEKVMAADPTLVYVDVFEKYVRDMQRVCDALLKGMPEPRMLFCHSMGGAVSALFMEENPDFFRRAALCAPMIAPTHGPVPIWAARAICGVAGALGKSRKRIFISKPYAGHEDFAASCTTSRERFDWYEQERGKDPLLRTNGPSYGWFRESLKVTKKILRPGAVERIRIPVRVWSGDQDDVVLSEPQIAFVSRLPNGSRAVVPGAKHEIYRSKDDVLFPWWREVLSFLNEEKG